MQHTLKANFLLLHPVAYYEINKLCGNEVLTAVDMNRSVF
jgi:hypothetical protein